MSHTHNTGRTPERTPAPKPEAKPEPDLSTVISDALEQAGISGLCIEGQIELAVQAARQVLPDASDAALLERVMAEVA